MNSDSKFQIALSLPRIRLLCGLSLFLTTMLASPAFPSQLDSILKEESLPGVAWATIDANTVETGGNGYAELADERPMTAATKVQVGSVTKTLVAVGVLRLVSTGQLSLDTNVEQLLPELHWDNPWHAETPVTVRHLLEHTAGIDNLRMWQFLNTNVTADTPLTDAFPPNHEHLLQIRTRPGSQYSYSNMGYAMLGLVIEHVSAERYEDYLAREILEPLGMHDSSFRYIVQSQDSRLAMGYLEAGIAQSSVTMFLRPAGQFTTTADDMQRLLRFFLGNGMVDGKEIIAAEYLDSLGTPSTTDAYLAGLPMGHGLALATRDRHGVLGECHPGETFGFRAYLCVFREQSKAFFYAVNADSENADYERLNRYFIEQIDVAPVSAIPRVPTDRLDEYTGLYQLAPSNMAQFAWLDWMFNSLWLSVDQHRGGLVMHSLQGPERLLLPLGDGLFRAADRRLASHIFFGTGNEVLSYGLTTWRKASPLLLCLGWVSLILGALGLLYIALKGLWSILSGRLLENKAILPPWLCLMAFALPVYLYTTQPFLRFGEVTAASLILATLSVLLPLSLCLSWYQLAQSQNPSRANLYAVIASLQLCLVLLSQGVLPVVFWR
ncbi:serine hydrolase domain-containing protein [Congregibacter variabilis]|uniref:Serine hydrolase domain-containing protein n=1 Tax=Congregibacter variabilis TaxID=3081200 RepID=A0ABZ0I1Z3_9GAMM|nr:serine hydrolase domain-containing protein [Congregibacter sp. IMCC43200]